MARWYQRAAYIFGLVLLGNAGFVFAQEPQNPGPPTSTLRVNVDRVSVGVTVEGTHRDFVKDLRREDFRIYDNGVEQQLTGFLPIEEPAQIVLLVESGPAAFFLRPSVLQVAETFLSNISSSDRVAIVSYSRVPMLELNFTTDKVEASQALLSMNFMLGFAQLNLVSSLTTTMDWLSSLPGKKTIVLLSSGVDDSISLDPQLIQQKLQASDIHILAVSTAGTLRKPLKGKKLSSDDRERRKHVKEGFVQADQLLRLLTGSTGGRVYFPRDTKEFTEAYAEIAQLIRNEYLLDFVPPLADGKLHSLQVKVRHSWYRVSYRQAYLAPSPPSQDVSR